MSLLTDDDRELRCVIADLKAENEALRKDAERYRWLRSNSVPPYHDHFPVARYFDTGEMILGEALDAAIDAAKETP